MPKSKNEKSGGEEPESKYLKDGNGFPMNWLNLAASAWMDSSTASLPSPYLKRLSSYDIHECNPSFAVIVTDQFLILGHLQDVIYLLLPNLDTPSQRMRPDTPSVYSTKTYYIR